MTGEGVSLLTREEASALARQARAGNFDARAELIVRNLPLAYHVARRWGTGRLELEDARQEAALALVRVAETFDPDRGNTFATMATPALVRQLSRARTEALPLRTPYRMGALAGSLRRARAALAAELGRVPTHDELADREGVKVEHVAAALAIPETTAQVEGLPLQAAGEDPAAQAMVRVAHEELRRAIESALQRLRPRQAQVLRLRVMRGLTLEAAGQALGMTREGARQLEARGLEVLRRDPTLTRWKPEGC